MLSWHASPRGSRSGDRAHWKVYCDRMKRFWNACAGWFATSIELIGAFWQGPYWWLVPVVIMLLMASIVLIALQAAPLISPMVYALF